jgi:hypothetical protein
MSCMGGSSKNQNSIELVTEKVKQESIFRNLITVVNTTLPEAMQNDSLAFLILPVQASCPACRNKTIDSIVNHRKDLADNHFIIISANGGRKTISSYFQENDKRLPVIEKQLFLDSTNQAFKLALYDKKPTIYYTYNRKAYKKVAAIPSTVRDDLREFFSGYRNQKQLAKK